MVDPPAPWSGDYRALEAGGWRALVHRDADFSGLPKLLADPERLFESPPVIRWFKRRRNRLAEVQWPPGAGDGSLVLKAYGASSLFNRLRLMRGLPRAVRHWNNAWLLTARGVSTPRPLLLALPGDGAGEATGQGVIAVEMLRGYRELEDFIPRDGGEAPLDLERVVTACGRFVRAFHDCGLVHRDLSATNILVPDDWSGDADQLLSRFSLVDINRVRDVPAEGMSIKLRIQDLERVYIPDHLLDTYYRAYAGGDAGLLAEWPRFLKYRNGYRKIRSTANPLARGLLKLFTYWPRTG